MKCKKKTKKKQKRNNLFDIEKATTLTFVPTNLQTYYMFWITFILISSLLHAIAFPKKTLGNI